MRPLSLVIAAAALACCGAASAQTLRVALQDDPDVLDPHRARTFVGRIVFTSLCDKLVDVSPTLEIVPQLAREWTWSDDGRTLTLKLVEGAKFHDGSTIDAAAVKANLDRARTLPDSVRKSEVASIESVEAPDANTVVLRLNRPDASLLSQLSDRAGMMMSPASFDQETSRNPVCSGPYRFKERVQNDRIVLEKFAEHRDAAQYHFDRVVFTPIPDSTVRLANLRAGDYDLIERLAPSDFATVKSDARLALASVTGLGYQAIEVNTAHGPRSDNPLGRDKRVRQALDLAIDRDVINEIVGAGIFTPARQGFAPASFAHDKSITAGGRDPQRARALLKEAGFDRVPVEITFGNNTTMQQVFELVQAMGAEAGFDITLRPTEFATLQKTLQSGDYQAGQSGWSGRADPDGNIHQFVSCKGGLNDGRYCNAEVDKLLNEARSTPDAAARRPLYDAAQAILREDRPIIYLYYLPWPYAMNRALEGFTPYPDGMIRLKGVRLNK